MRINNLFESATSGATSTASGATAPAKLGKVQRRTQKPGTNALDGDSLFGEDQQVKELSNEKLGQYKKAAGADASAADQAGDTKKGNKRFKGIVKATNKQFANDAKKNVKEGLGRMSGSPSAYDRDYASSVSGMGRPNDHRGLGQELAHETNNIAISINGKVWKVVPGRGTADSREEKNYLNGMQSWAEKKSAATGKKWSVSLTGANVSEGVRDLGYDAQSLIMKLRRDVEEKRLQPTPQAVLAAARELAGDMDFAPQLLVKQVLGQGVAEGPNDGKEDNFTIDDIKNLERIRDFETLKAQAKELIKGKPVRRMKPEKISWFYNHIDTLKNPLAVIKMMYDLMLAGEGNKVIGSRNSMSSNSYRTRFGEQGVAEGFNGEYDDEAGMADNNLETLRRSVEGIDELISAGDNLPEWCQEKIAVAKSMLVTVWDYMASEEERGAEVNEHKKGVRAMTYTAKPRNFVAKNAAATTSGAGAHKDKKKAAKQGEVKHKNKEPAYESKLFAALENKLK
jgi:hypothetical protein